MLWLRPALPIPCTNEKDILENLDVLLMTLKRGRDPQNRFKRPSCYVVIGDSLDFHLLHS